MLNSINQKQIVLADDVVFSGSVLRELIKMFNKYKIEVVGISTCITTQESYNYFNSALKFGLKSGFLMEQNVVDQICERDFYFGIAGSGISVLTGTNVVKAPYFLPFGNPVERASIPKESACYFSDSCIKRSIALWSEIEKLSKKTFYIKDLPEQIQNTSSNDEIVKTLKKGLQ